VAGTIEPKEFPQSKFDRHVLDTPFTGRTIGRNVFNAERNDWISRRQVMNINIRQVGLAPSAWSRETGFGKFNE
jgi:hypothetical protein